MTRYRKRDLRAADLFGLVLFGAGLVFLTFALLEILAAEPPPAKAAPNVAGARGSAALWLLAVVFLALGTALNLKVRQLLRTGGREPGDYPGVPE